MARSGLLPALVSAVVVGVLATSAAGAGAAAHVAAPDVVPVERVGDGRAVPAGAGAHLSGDAAEEGEEGELRYSRSADYAASRPLDGAVLTGHVAIFLHGDASIDSVTFSLDGRTVRTERVTPYDLSADTAGLSHLLDTDELAAGPHRVTASVLWASGRRTGVVATFTTPGDGTAVTSTLTVDGDTFRLDGAPFDMWGIRTASATHTQGQTDHLIDQLDTYAAYGVNTVAVYYMGSRGASYDPFTPDGTSVDAGHQGRLEQIIRAADERGMVVLVGIFYQAAPLRLRDAEAVRQAVATVATRLRPFRNVVLNIANEHSSDEYRDTADVFDFRDPRRIVELLDVVRAVDPARVAGGGGYHRSHNITIGLSAPADVLLFDTGLGDNREGSVEHRAFVRAGVTKPVVNVEQFGGLTNGRPRGVFGPDLRDMYLTEVASAATEPGLSTFFHNGPWLQVRPMRYDLGGAGTERDPGIRWYFEAVRDARGTTERQ